MSFHFILLISTWTLSSCAPDVGGYHSHEQLVSTLNGLAVDYPHLSKAYDLREKSVEGRELKVIQIGKRP